MKPLRLLLLDMDGTLTTVKSPWQFVHEEIGRWEQDGLPLLQDYLAGRLDYEEFCRLDVETWNAVGLTLPEVGAILDRIPVPEEALGFLRDAHAAGLKLAIISTGFVHTANRILDAAGIPDGARLVAANALGLRDGRLRPIVHVGDGGPVGKAAWARRILRLHGLPPEQAAAIGDGETDRPMFEAVGTWWKVKGPQELGPGGEIRLRLLGKS